MAHGLRSLSPPAVAGPLEADVYTFGPCRVDVARHVVTRDGQPVALAPKTFDLLLILIRSGGRVLTRQELIAALWPDTFVEEANLSFQISALRKALGEGAEQWIETVPRLGYRFTPAVSSAAGLTGSEPAGVGTSAPAVRDLTTVVHGEEQRSLGLPVVLVSVVITALVTAALLRPSSMADHRDFAWTTANPLTAFHGFEAAPSLSPDGSQVAFHWGGPSQDNMDVYVTSLGGSEPLRLTTDRRPEGWPAWSPDGRHIAFLRTGEQGMEVAVMPALGGTARLVGRLGWPEGLAYPKDHRFGHVSGVRLLSWTPDGRWIAVGGVIGDKRGLWLFEADGQGRRQLTDNTPTTQSDTAPVFSADGRRVAFVRFLYGGRDRVLQLLALDEDFRPAGSPTVLVSAAPLEVIAAAWEPDGRSLVYAAGGHHTSSRLWRVRLAADRMSRLGHPELLAVGDQATGLDIARSGRLVYSAFFRDTGLWRLDVTHPGKGLSATDLPDSTFDEFGPAYSPDGTKLMFVSTRSGIEELWMSDTDGHNVRQVTSLRWCLGEPHWSPDGTRVSFVVDTGSGRHDVYLLDVGTGEVEPLTSTPQLEYAPHWSADGAWIYFGRGPTMQQVELHRTPSSGGPSVRVTEGTGIPSLDGRSVFVRRQTGGLSSLWQVPLDGGQPRQLAERVVWGTVVAGRRAVYFVSPIGPSLSSIEEIDIASGRQERLAEFGLTPVRGAALSPDERTLIVSAITATGANLMVAEPQR